MENRNENMDVHRNGMRDRIQKYNVKNITGLAAYTTVADKAAFTLAETLITLGIIGVVAAMTIPNLITEHQKRATVTKLQRAISVLNQAYRLAYDDVGEANAEEAFNMGSEEYFNTYWAPYIKVLTYCSSYDVCGYDSNKPFHYPDGNSESFNFVYEGYSTTFFTADGFLYIIRTGGSNPIKENREIVVDINGSAGPNQYGRDVFWLYRLDNDDGGSIVPYGYSYTDTACNSNCSTKNNSGMSGRCCTEKIRRAGWKIEKDYPW